MEPLMLHEDPAESPAQNTPHGYLEVLNRAGRVTERLAVTDRDICIGRAYDNDLILDDPYACAHHARLRWGDGALQVLDLQSVNGVAVGDRRRAPAQSLECNERLRIGRTLLRFRRTDFQVVPAQLDHQTINPFQVLNKPLYQAVAFLLAVAAVLLETYLDSVIKIEPLKYVPSVVAMLAMVMIWSMLWSFASRLVLQQWRFWTHSAVALCGYLLLQSAEAGWGYFAFAFGIDNSTLLFFYLLSLLLLGLLIFSHLHFVSILPWPKLARTAAGVATVVVGLALAINLANEEDFTRWPQYDITLKAPVFKLAASQTSAEFFQEMQQLLDRVDAEALDGGD